MFFFIIELLNLEICHFVRNDGVGISDPYQTILALN